MPCLQTEQEWTMRGWSALRASATPEQAGWVVAFGWGMLTVIAVAVVML